VHCKKLMRGFSEYSSRRIQALPASLAMHEGGDVMERRHFLKFAFGVAAGAAALAASAQAAPLAPHPLAEDERLPAKEAARPAVTTKDEVESLKPEEVRWGHHTGTGIGTVATGAGIAATGTTGTGTAVTGKGSASRYQTAAVFS
jgi:hypothetical protein